MFHYKMNFSFTGTVHDMDAMNQWLSDYGLLSVIRNAPSTDAMFSVEMKDGEKRFFTDNVQSMEPSLENGAMPYEGQSRYYGQVSIETSQELSVREESMVRRAIYMNMSSHMMTDLGKEPFVSHEERRSWGFVAMPNNRLIKDEGVMYTTVFNLTEPVDVGVANGWLNRADSFGEEREIYARLLDAVDSRMQEKLFPGMDVSELNDFANKNPEGYKQKAALVAAYKDNFKDMSMAVSADGATGIAAVYTERELSHDELAFLSDWLGSELSGDFGREFSRQPFARGGIAAFKTEYFSFVPDARDFEDALGTLAEQAKGQQDEQFPSLDEALSDLETQAENHDMMDL